MVKILFVIFSCFIALATCEETDLFRFSTENCSQQKEWIEHITRKIDTTENLLDNLSLHQTRGLAYFYFGEIDCALQDFNFILTTLSNGCVEEKTLVAEALWGRLFCHAFQGLFEETQNDIYTIRYFFIEYPNCKFTTENSSHLGTVPSADAYVCLTAKFAAPKEKISPYECKSRVYRTAQAMRAIALKIPDFTVQSLVNTAIDTLENIATHCCNDLSDWTQCLEPIVDAWHNLQATWEQLVDLFHAGIAITPRILGSAP